MSLDKELMDVAQAYLSMHEKTKKEDASNDKSDDGDGMDKVCLLYTSPSPRD